MLAVDTPHVSEALILTFSAAQDPIFCVGTQTHNLTTDQYLHPDTEPYLVDLTVPPRIRMGLFKRRQRNSVKTHD